MRARALTLAAALGAALTVAGCGSGPSTSSNGHASSPKLSAADFSACTSLDNDTSNGNQAGALNEDFGLDGRRMGTISAHLKPYAQLVGASAQLRLSGADDGKLGEYVGEMRGVCEAEGWRAAG